MTERMAAGDVASLHRESPATPQHVGGLSVFVPPHGGFDYERLLRLLEERISLAPRYRQKVRTVPGGLIHPVWVDDPHFDITYHVRRSALPRPGTDAQLLEFCARVQARMLDRSRPLWEMYLVEGLSGDRVAIVTKTHEAMVGEPDGIDLWQVVLDAAAAPRRTVPAPWRPRPEPSSLALLRDAAAEVIRRPVALADIARDTLYDARSLASRLSVVGGVVATAAGAVTRRQPDSPLQAGPGEQRRLAIVRTRLADYRAVREALGGSVNDVVLAVVTGALRGWLLSRAHSLEPSTTVRALVPVGVVDPARPSGSRHPARAGRTGYVRPVLVDLPVGEPNPALRLAQLRHAMAAYGSAAGAVSADRIATLGGFAPPTLHAVGARATSGLTRRMFSLVITNVPGPQVPLYAAGARMTEMFPVLPLGRGQALSVALTSYDGGVFYGVNADRDAVPDIGVFAELVTDSLEELGAAAASAARRARRARRTRTDGS